MTNGIRNISPDVLLDCDTAARNRPYCGPCGHFETKDSKRIRYIRDICFDRPATETFDEFLIVHLKYILGKSWGRSQVNLPRKQQHVIIQWLFDYCEETRRHIDDESSPNTPKSAKPTGSVHSLLSLADDLYRLSLVGQLSDTLLERLRKRNSFQGVKYEIALAASFVRAGFDIQWINEQGKHAEFTATIPTTNDEIIVEAKSRRRPGVLHENGTMPDLDKITADVNNLYCNALKKSTHGKPFLISIDVNLPHNSNYLSDIMKLLDRHSEPTQSSPAKEFALLCTNFNWHYDESGLAQAPQFVYTFPQWCVAKPNNKDAYIAILQAYNHYGKYAEGVYE